MSGLPTLRVRESIHLQKIQEFKSIIEELKSQTVILKNVDLNINREDIEKLENDIELLINLKKVLREENLLFRVQQKIKSLQRNRIRRERIYNLSMNVEPPSYNEVEEMDLLHIDS